jgi:hypothetical protein
MIEYTFPFSDEHLSKRKTLNTLINTHFGTFIATETQDGAFYRVSFEDVIKAHEFKEKANNLIPYLISTSV